MFTLKDICDVAIQIEKNGERTYRNAQSIVDDPQIKSLLGSMADEEAKHVLWFKNLSDSMDKPIQHPQIEEMGKNLLKDSVGNQTFSLSKTVLTEAATLNRIIEQSIEFEKDTIIFYEMLREFIDDKEILDQLELIIQEEQSHISKLNMFNSANS